MDDNALTYWGHVPARYQYLQKYASEFGLRGLTVCFGVPPSLDMLASQTELAELRSLYETIARRDDAIGLSEWCRSVSPGDAAIEAREEVRGLLLLFERLGECGVTPFDDERVRYYAPPAAAFDWSVLPPTLGEWEPWLVRFESLRTEDQIYAYVQTITVDQLRELKGLRELKNRKGEELLRWCESNNRSDRVANNEAFQAEWLFVLLDFAESRLDEL